MLRLGHFGDVGQPAVVPCPGKLLRLIGGPELLRHVLGDGGSRLEERRRAGLLRLQCCDRLVVMRALGNLVLRLDTLPGLDGKQFAHGKRYGRAKGPVGHTRTETIGGAPKAKRASTSYPSGGRRHQADSRKSRDTKHSLSRSIDI